VIKRGEIYLVNFGKKYNSEFGKVRPALIVQNDVANRNIEFVAFKGVSVLPLTSVICGGDLRVLVQKRNNLEKNSEVCINEICTLDLSRIDGTSLLCVATLSELSEIDMKLSRHLGLK